MPDPETVGNAVLIGIVGCVGAGLATGVGALPVLFIKNVSERMLDTLLGFAAGVMLAATSFSLIVPAIADEQYGGIWVTVAGMIAGGALLAVADKVVPHLHMLSNRAEGRSSRLAKVWLFVFAITIHNLPEGLAVGLGFGSGDISAGLVLAIGIGLQNMPEGLAVALPLRREGYSRLRALWVAAATGLVEPIMGLVGIFAVMMMRPLLPYGLAFAAGAMLYVISDEIIPESHRRGHEREATAGVLIGFIIMMVLDNVFG